MATLPNFKMLAISAAVLSIFSQGSQASVTSDQHFSESVTVEASEKVQPGVTSYDNRYAGIIADEGKLEISIDDGALLTVTGNLQADGDDRLFGAYVGRNDSLSISGDVNINLESEVGAQIFRVYGDIDINGTINAVAQGGSTGDVAVVGVDVRPDGDVTKTVTFRGDSTSIKTASSGLRVIGVQNFNASGTVINFNADKTEIFAENSATSTTYTQGLLNYQGTTNFNGNAFISVKGGSADTYGVDIQCDPGNKYDTVVNFAGETTEIDVSASGAVYALRPSGAPGAMNFTGKTVNVSANSAQSHAFGVYSQYGAELNVTDPNSTVNITVNAAQDAYGIYNSTYGGDNTFQFGSVRIEGALNINVESSTRAVGISNAVYTGDKLDVINQNDGVYLNGSTNIIVAAEGADAQAIGVVAANTNNGGQAPAAKTAINDLTISATGSNGAVATGLSGSDKAQITITGNSQIQAVGENSTGMVLNDSSLIASGELDISGESTGFALDETSSVTVQKDSSLSTNTMNSTGQTILADNSSLSVSGNTGSTSKLGSISANNSVVNVGAGKYEISNFTGTDKAIRFTDLAQNEGVTVANTTGAIKAVAAGNSNDQYANAQEAADALLQALSVRTHTDGNTLEVEQGAVNNGLLADIVGANQLANVRETENTTVASFGSVALLGAFQWRHDMNDLTKRMGELRDVPQGVGTWARLYGSEQEYDGIESTNTSIQIGADYDVAAGWKVGGAFTYTDGSSDFSNGTADHEAFGFAVYGTWLSESGQFVDLIAKYSRLDTDFSIDGMDGSYDNNAWSVSAEYGWHLKLSDLAFVEPQVELTYGTVLGDDIQASNGVRVEQDDFTSFVGRLGVRGGFYFPEKKGNVYARVSVLHDFDGEMETNASLGRAHNTIKDDMGGTWVEYGVGANFSWTDTTYTYVDLERNSGGEVVEHWRWNVGLRHVF